MLQVLLWLGLSLAGFHEVLSCRARYLGGGHVECKFGACIHYYDTAIECHNTTLTNNKLLVDEDDTDGIRHIKRITFQHSVVPTIPDFLFEEYKSVETIYINNNQVETIESKAFYELTNLIILNLQDNFITSIKSGTFDYLNSLKILNISNNYLTWLDNGIFDNLSELYILDLSNNNLTSINTNLFIGIKHKNLFRKLDNLELLDLTNNKLQNFSEIFFCNVLPSLTILKIGCNMINFTKNNIFDEISNVKQLTLNHNKIHVNITFGENLTYLDVSFTMLPLSVSTFENCKKLGELLLTNNNITKITAGYFRNLHNLRILNLSFNNLDHIELSTLNGLKNLKILNLANNQLFSVTVSEFPIRNIQVLNLDNNLLSKIDVSQIFEHMRRANVTTSIKISLNNNRWRCDWLPEAIEMLQNNNFIILDGTSFTVLNVNGIACIEAECKNLNMSTHKIQTTIENTPKYTTRSARTTTTPTTEKNIIFSTATPTRSTTKSVKISTSDE